MQEDNKESKVFATIKLPEIMTGMDDRDFRKERKVKAQDYKKDLDIFNEQQASVNKKTFLGMNDEEILHNANDFKELGLL